MPTARAAARRARTHLDDLQHLHARDLAVAVQVVHVEGPVQLLLEAAPGRDGQGTDELSEVDGAVPVLVEGAEGMLGELGGVPIREELQSRTEGTDAFMGAQGRTSPSRLSLRPYRQRGRSTWVVSGQGG